MPRIGKHVNDFLMTFSLRQGEKGDDDDDDDELFLIFFHKSEKLTQGQKIPRTVRILHKEKNSIGMQEQAGDKNMSRLNIKKKTKHTSNKATQ